MTLPKQRRVIVDPLPDQLSRGERAAVERMWSNGWTVARHPWTGLVTDMPVNQVQFADELDGRGPATARAFAALHDGTGPERWKELLDLDPADLLSWNLAMGCNVTRTSIDAMTKAGLTHADAASWFTTVTLASQLRLSNALGTYGDDRWHLKSNAASRFESWHAFILRHHRKGRTPEQMLGWAWDTPAWLLDALDGKPVKFSIAALKEEGFTLYAEGFDGAPDNVALFMANTIGGLDRFRLRWMLERREAGATWQDLCRALYRFDQVWSPNSENLIF